MFDIFLEYIIVHILHLATFLLFLMKFKKTKHFFLWTFFGILNDNNIIINSIIMQYIIIIIWKHNAITKISMLYIFIKFNLLTLTVSLFKN